MIDFVERYRDVIVQIATPNSTGTGFYLRDPGLIVTNHHVIEGNQMVVIEGTRFTKQLVRVYFTDEKYDLAFLEAPDALGELPAIRLNLESSLRERDSVIAIGHPFGLKFSVKSGIVSNTREILNGIPYLHIDAALNPGNSGGPLVNNAGDVVGVNTFVIQDGDNTGFSLPVVFLHETLEAYSKVEPGNACRCKGCLNIVTPKTVENGFCTFCGNRVTLPGALETYVAAGISNTIERMISTIGHDVALSRSGSNAWEIQQGSAKIMITYQEKIGLITADAILCELPKERIKPVYEYLLRENYANETLTLSVHNQDIILSLLIYDRHLNEETGLLLLQTLFEKADYYDNVLVEKYGASWKTAE